MSIDKMGDLFHAMDKLAEAEPYHREALEARRRVLGDEHSDTLRLINNIGALLDILSRHDDAAELLLAGEAAARRVWTEGTAQWQEVCVGC